MTRRAYTVAVAAVGNGYTVSSADAAAVDGGSD
jgi:hypothetical protein